MKVTTPPLTDVYSGRRVDVVAVSPGTSDPETETNALTPFQSGLVLQLPDHEIISTVIAEYKPVGEKIEADKPAL